MSFVFRRLLLLVPVAIGVTIIVFFMIHLIPGDPARTILGIHATPTALAIRHGGGGLTRPLPSQYWLFIDRLLHGNLGSSLYYGTPAAGLIFGRLPATLWLFVSGAVLPLVISWPLPIPAPPRRNGLRDHLVRAVPLLGLGMPPFWVGLLLQYGLAVSLHVFPVTGYG